MILNEIAVKNERMNAVELINDQLQLQLVAETSFQEYQEFVFTHWRDLAIEAVAVELSVLQAILDAAHETPLIDITFFAPSANERLVANLFRLCI